MTMTQMLALLSVVVSVVGFLAAVHGSAKTQFALRKAHQSDRIIDAMAWFDRKLFRHRNGDAR